MMEYTISDPFDREDYHEDFTPLVLIEISDVIDPIDYHDAPETIYITLNRTQLMKFINDLEEKLNMMKFVPNS